MVLFTDLNERIEHKEELIKGLQHLHFRKHDILLFNVFDKKLELDLDYDDVPTQFVDAETGDSIKLNPQEIRSQYTQAQMAHRKELIEKCTQYKIDCHFADINEDLESTIGAFFEEKEWEELNNYEICKFNINYTFSIISILFTNRSS